MRLENLTGRIMRVIGVEEVPVGKDLESVPDSAAESEEFEFVDEFEKRLQAKLEK
jgi:hypothetical protein